MPEFPFQKNGWLYGIQVDVILLNIMAIVN